MKTKNILFMTDSYKVSHAQQYLPNTTNVYSYFESRKGAENDETVFVGLQYILKEYLEGQVITQEKIDEAEFLYGIHFGTDIFNKAGFEYILNNHGGVLPIRIKAVPEGTPVTVSNILMSIEVLDEQCNWVMGWLSNFLETILTHVWYPSTVATRSREIKKVIYANLVKSCETPDLALPFCLHDFGCRGVSSMESAGIGGMGHLVNFCGTDTVQAMVFARDYYYADLKTLAFSVPASEHSVATSAGPDGEYDYLLRMIRKYPNGIVSIVADSYNISRFIKEYMRDAKDEIIERWKNGTSPLNRVVVRPDSPRWEGDTPHAQIAWILETLWDIFGGTINSKGYRVLHPAVGVIYGDGLSKNEICGIYNYVTNHNNFGNTKYAYLGNHVDNTDQGERAKGFDCSSIVVGQGGGLLQKVNRDTQRFAFKCSAQKRDGIWYDVSKNPLDKTKASKAGRLALIKEDGQYQTVRIEELNGRKDLLETVFENGKLVKEYTFEQVRENAKL